MLHDQRQHTAAILNLAANLIRTRGWTRGMLQDREGRLCLHGALLMAISGSLNRPHAQVGLPDHQNAAIAVYRTLINKNPSFDDAYTIPMYSVGWNNHVARDGEEVALVLEEAAQLIMTEEYEMA